MDHQELLPAGPPSPSRELIPYPTREVLLRHKNSVVIYDPQKERAQQLTASRVHDDENKCPLCMRPFEERATSAHATNLDDDLDDSGPDVESDYFRLLANSRYHSPSSTPPISRGYAGALPALSARQVSSTSSHHEQPDHERISSAAFTPGYFERFFTIERELGRGGKGTVLLVRHELDGVFLGRFACKRIPVGDDRRWLEDVLLEVSMLQDVSHKNLVAYRHVWLEDFQASQFGPMIPHLYILQQYCNGGTLFEHILSQNGSNADSRERLKERLRRRSKGHMEPPSDLHSKRKLPFDDIFSFFKDITSGLAHLHSKGFVHRDLKPQNCLLHRSDGVTRVLVSDFGEMQTSNIRRGPNATGYTGTISFSAPEVVSRGLDGNYGDFTPKSDVFSLGMIVYFMCFARLPYSSADEDLREEYEDIEQLRDEIAAWTGLDSGRRDRDDLPERLYKYLRTLLARNPDQRPTTEAILQAIKSGIGAVEHGPGSFERPTRTSPTPEQERHPSLKADEKVPSASLVTQRPRSIDEDEVVPTSRDTYEEVNEYNHSSPLGKRNTEQSPRRLLLPAPPSRSLRSTSLRWVQSLRDSRSVQDYGKIVILLFKVWSLSRACFNQHPKELLFYAFTGLAAIDLCFSQSLQSVAALLLLHFGLLHLLSWQDLLCERRH